MLSMENSPVIRCIKFGYNLTDRKDWTKAADCQYYSPKVPADSRKRQSNKARTASKTSKAIVSKARKGKPKGWF